MNRIWLIGASEGIGRALAIELDKDKNNSLILSARNNERLDELSTLLSTQNITVQMDVTNMKSVSDAFAKIENSNNSKIDIVIYCAGYYKPLSSSSINVEETEKMIDINLTGCIRVLSSVIPSFIEAKSGHIVLIGSIAGYRGLPNSIGYGSSKAGLIHLAENLRCDLSKYNIKVQIINPGFVKTRLTDLNNFYMPSIMSADEAAKNIVQKIQNNSFESRFPFFFANILKLISKLPYWIYFKIIRLIKF